MAYTDDQIKKLHDLKAINKANLDAHIDTARHVDLPELMRQDGYIIESSGISQYEVKHAKKSSRAGNLFLDKKTSCWLYSTIDGSTENAISYIQRERSLPFPAAVRYLDPTTPDLVTLKNSGAEKFRPELFANEAARRETIAQPREKTIISFSEATTAEHEKAGREYCKKRGISDATIAFAVHVKTIAFGISNFASDIAAKRPGVRFIGFDADGNMRNAETRLLTDKRIALTETGSDKSFCPILAGSTKNVHIVEGGFDGLALRDLCRRHSIEQPTIIIAGGLTKSFIENERIKPFLQHAEKIIIWAENEKSDTPAQQIQKQLATDKAHYSQREAMIAAGITAKISINKPTGDFKDLAEKNFFEQAKATRERPKERQIDFIM